MLLSKVIVDYVEKSIEFQWEQFKEIEVDVICNKCKKFIKLGKPRYREINAYNMGELIEHRDYCNGCKSLKVNLL